MNRHMTTAYSDKLIHKIFMDPDPRSGSGFFKNGDPDPDPAENYIPYKGLSSNKRANIGLLGKFFLIDDKYLYFRATHYFTQLTFN